MRWVLMLAIIGTMSFDLMAKTTLKVVRPNPSAHYAGRIVNNTNNEIHGIKVKVSFLDPSGNLVCVGETYPSDGSSKADPLKPGTESSFDGMISLKESDFNSELTNQYSTKVTLVIYGEIVDEENREISLVSFIGRIIPRFVKEIHSVAMSDYSRINTGMTYDDVVGIIGFDGEEQSRSELGGNTTIMYQWSNPDGSGLNAIFQNGEMTTKSQAGLK